FNMTGTLYGANVSPFVRKVRAYLMEKGIEYTHEPVNPFDPPADYRETSPLGRIPAWRDANGPLADSSVICQYLERLHPTPALYPAGDYDYARALWLEEYCDGGLVPEAAGKVFRPLVLAPMMMNQPVTAEVRAGVDKALAENVGPMWAYLEATLGDRDFFVADQLSIADLAVASTHVNLWHAGVDVDAAAFPGLAAFIGRMFARPSFAALIAEESPTWSRRDA
ncbi:MAG: glutathione S-transferase family protein, partial [Gammaproteobacteria bacterium]